MSATIRNILNNEFSPHALEIMDESADHAGHNPAAKEGGTHLRIRIVSDHFHGKSRIERHRMIYTALKTQLQERVHALAITALTPKEA